MAVIALHHAATYGYQRGYDCEAYEQLRVESLRGRPLECDGRVIAVEAAVRGRDLARDEQQDRHQG